MAFKPGQASTNRFNAGDHVEVVDASSKLQGKIGIVEFFVDDNIYVKFTRGRLAPTKMFFPDQLRPTEVSQPQPIRGGTSTLMQKLRHAVQKMVLARKRSSRRLRQP